MFHILNIFTADFLSLQIKLEKGVESWLRQLLEQVTQTVQKLMTRCRTDIEKGMSVEDWTFKVSDFIPPKINHLQLFL